MTIHTPACSMRIQYDHLQFFVDALKPLAHYKAIEERLTSFAKLLLLPSHQIDPPSYGRPMLWFRPMCEVWRGGPGHC